MWPIRKKNLHIKNCLKFWKSTHETKKSANVLNSKKNRIYFREEFKESLGMNFVSPFEPEREFKVYKSCKCSQIICSRVH